MIAELKPPKRTEWPKDHYGNFGLLPDETFVVPREQDFIDKAGGDVDYLKAPDLQDIANDLIRTCNELQHLKYSQVVLLWKKEGGESGGQYTLGRCTKATGLLAHFAECYWVVWVAADHAEKMALTRGQIEALIHHELQHVGLDGKPSKHDWEGFSKNVERYGAWYGSLRMARNAFTQMKLADFGAEALARMAEPIGDGIDSVTIAHGGRSVTLDGEVKKRLRRQLREE